MLYGEGGARSGDSSQEAVTIQVRYCGSGRDVERTPASWVCWKVELLDGADGYETEERRMIPKFFVAIAEGWSYHQ